MRYFAKRKLIVLLIIILIFSTSIIQRATKATFNKYKKITIVLDAGHGGIDGGTVGVNSKVKESHLNLIMVKELEKLFTSQGFKIVLTRDGDYGLYGDESKGFKLRDLKKRVEITDKSNAVVMLSIHMNKYSSKERRGVQVFYKQGSESSEMLAKKVQLSVNLLTEQPKMYDALKGDYYILNCNARCSIIVECGFLSSPIDEELLLSDTYRKKLAKAIYSGVFNYFSNN